MGKPLPNSVSEMHPEAVVKKIEALEGELEMANYVVDVAKKIITRAQGVLTAGHRTELIDALNDLDFFKRHG